MNAKSDADFRRFSTAVYNLNDLFRKKYVLYGAKIASMYFVGALLLVLLYLELFSLAYSAIGISGLAYIAACKYLGYIDHKIATNIGVLEHLREEESTVMHESVLLKGR